jgi:hypothetical protein
MARYSSGTRLNKASSSEGDLGPRFQSASIRLTAFEAKIEEANLSDDQLSTNMPDGTIPGALSDRSARQVRYANIAAHARCGYANLESVA